MNHQDRTIQALAGGRGLYEVTLKLRYHEVIQAYYIPQEELEGHFFVKPSEEL